MTSVLLTNAYFYRLDAKQWRFKQPYPPLGTIQAAALLREAGISVAVADNSLKKSPQEIAQPLLKLKPSYLVIYEDGFNYLTKMCLTVMREAAFVLAKEGKKAGCTVIISSSDATDHSEKYLTNGVDYVIRGEGEQTLLELVQKLERNESVEHVAGLAFQHHTNITVTSPRAVMRQLDELPLPAWDLINLNDYKKIWKKYKGYFSLNIATTRGCPYKCNWCAKPIYGNRYNSRSPQHVITEIEQLLESHKPDHFWMCDDIFGLKPGWIEEFATLVKRRGLKFRYKIQSRADLLQNEAVVKALAASGAETVWIGAESGSQKILDAMDKGITLEQIQQATRLLEKYSIKPAFFLQFGYLGETREDIDKTISMVLQLMPAEIGISVSYPLPGTKFYETVKGMLTKKQNWTDSDDLSMMFYNNYTPAYYKTLHRYVHNRYKIQRGLQSASVTPFKGRLKNFFSMLYNLPLSWIHSYQLNKLSRISI